jgi:hypothetical protein
VYHAQQSKEFTEKGRFGWLVEIIFALSTI